MGKGGKKPLIPHGATGGAANDSRKYLSNVEQELLGLKEAHPDRENAYIALKYFQPAYECFSGVEPRRAEGVQRVLP